MDSYKNTDCVQREHKRKLDDLDNLNLKKKIKKDEHIEINSLEELISFAQDINLDEIGSYNFDIKRLYYLIEPLKDLENLVGMKKVKENIVNQIIFHLQELDSHNKHMMHTVIYGPPGVGKTELGKIIGNIYCELGLLDYNNYSFQVIKRTDLIGRYLGETARKTQAVIDKCEGGVMFIDEVYSLGNPEKKDSYSKECIDVINQNLSEKKSSFICIIAGYKEAVDKCFFAQNAGLERRFPYRYEIDNYSPNELREIFIKLVKKSEWEISDNDNIKLEFFEDNINYFKFNGGDLENLLEQVKIAHSRRIFGLSNKHRKVIIYKDILNGFDKFKENNNLDKQKNSDSPIPTMYS